jgi:hypothetical protein
LYRHVRKLNLAEIPAGAGVSGLEAGSAQAWDSVIFRHWDPNVLAVTLPVLEAGQMARLLGPSGGLAFLADGAGPVTVPGPAVVPFAALPPLRFSDAQMEALGRGRQWQSFARIERYLHACDPAFMATLPTDVLRRSIADADASGRALGLRSEKSLGRWTYLCMVTNGAISLDPQVLKGFRESPWSPEDTLDGMYEVMIHLADGQG